MLYMIVTSYRKSLIKYTAWYENDFQIMDRRGYRKGDPIVVEDKTVVLVKNIMPPHETQARSPLPEVTNPDPILNRRYYLGTSLNKAVLRHAEPDSGYAPPPHAQAHMVETFSQFGKVGVGCKTPILRAEPFDNYRYQALAPETPRNKPTRAGDWLRGLPAAEGRETADLGIGRIRQHGGGSQMPRTQ
jgi:hypothetical protein